MSGRKLTVTIQSNCRCLVLLSMMDIWGPSDLRALAINILHNFIAGEFDNEIRCNGRRPIRWRLLVRQRMGDGRRQGHIILFTFTHGEWHFYGSASQG